MLSAKRKSAWFCREDNALLLLDTEDGVLTLDFSIASYPRRRTFWRS